MCFYTTDVTQLKAINVCLCARVPIALTWECISSILRSTNFKAYIAGDLDVLSKNFGG